ncbi:hypothetical protein [Cytobacillus gottheilii]|nr:hypothetical protein [Cytobacillus gottheilii]
MKMKKKEEHKKSAYFEAAIELMEPIILLFRYLIRGALKLLE